VGDGMTKDNTALPGKRAAIGERKPDFLDGTDVAVIVCCILAVVLAVITLLYF
jgi:hypothetical protein